MAARNLRLYVKLVKGFQQRVRQLQAQESGPACQIIRSRKMKALAKVGVYKRKLQKLMTEVEIKLYGRPRSWRLKHKQQES